MSYTLLIIVIIGTITADFRSEAIPMKNELACKTAALSLINRGTTTERVKMLCISSETGEIFEIKP